MSQAAIEIEIGSSQFNQSRMAERDHARQARRDAEAAALAALHAARQAFVDEAADIYTSGAAAAADDSDRLEDIADQIVQALEKLRPAFEQLDIARDLALYRGPILSRARSRWDAARLATLTAESLAEELLCGHAAAVLAAAVRRLAP